MDYNFTYEFGSDDIETTIANSEPSIIIKEISETELPPDGKTKKTLSDMIESLHLKYNSYHEFDNINH